MLLPLLYLPAVMPAQASNDPELRRLLKEAIESDAGFVDRFEAQVWLLDMSSRFTTRPGGSISNPSWCSR
jgi:hypothetical protein